VIVFTIPCPPSLHAKRAAAARADLVRAIKLVCRPPVKRLYHVHLTFSGDWFTPAHEPNDRDPDNCAKVLFDAMAVAWGWGKRGRGDGWLNRDYAVKAVQSMLSETVTIRMS
jgi:hypothetical protein